MVTDAVSAFMDGEAGEQETRSVLRSLKNDARWRRSWLIYHVIGDVMRGVDGRFAMSAGFMARLRQRLELELTVAAPHFRWLTPAKYALAAASVAGLGVAVILMTAAGKPPLAQDRLAAPSQPAAAAPVSQVFLRAETAGFGGQFALSQEPAFPILVQDAAPYVRIGSGAPESPAR